MEIVVFMSLVRPRTDTHRKTQSGITPRLDETTGQVVDASSSKRHYASNVMEEERASASCNAVEVTDSRLARYGWH